MIKAGPGQRASRRNARNPGNERAVVRSVAADADLLVSATSSAPVSIVLLPVLRFPAA
jgi:hypothetical protein